MAWAKTQKGNELFDHVAFRMKKLDGAETERVKMEVGQAMKKWFIAVVLMFTFVATVFAADFEYKNVSYGDSPLGIEFIGEVTNSSGQDFSLANFALSVYSTDGKLLDVIYFNLSNFKHGMTKSFKALSQKDLPSNLKYKIQFENGF